VFRHPRELLGGAVHARFGAEFPIRFDLLGTMGGGSLPLQVHPLTEYIQDRFGMHYTQDESYYLLDAAEGRAPSSSASRTGSTVPRCCATCGARKATASPSPTSGT
jgi:hypothetical protein